MVAAAEGVLQRRVWQLRNLAILTGLLVQPHLFPTGAFAMPTSHFLCEILCRNFFQP